MKMKNLFTIPPKFFLPREVREGLQSEPLRIADVGGAMGLGDRWSSVEDCLEVISFEPDERSHSDGKVFRTALGETEEESRALQLSRMSAASSFYSHHSEMKRFVVDEWLDTVGEATVSVRTLDGVLEGEGIDFLKLDVEGAELEVLRGAEKTLESVLAIQIEVSFADRHIGAPGFHEIDTFLRRHGFLLHTVESEYWMRKNLVFGSNSNLQLIWGDAIYLRDGGALRECDLPKWVLVLQAYGFHDYGIDQLSSKWQPLLANSVRGYPAFFALAGWRWVLATVLLPFFWGKMWPRWKRLTAEMARACYRISARTGPSGGILNSGS